MAKRCNPYGTHIYETYMKHIRNIFVNICHTCVIYVDIYVNIYVPYAIYVYIYARISQYKLHISHLKFDIYGTYMSIQYVAYMAYICR